MFSITSVALLLLSCGALGSFGADPKVCQAAGASSGTNCQGDNATAVYELGLDTLTSVFGRTPVRWQETRIAFILASIDEAGYGEILRLHLEFNETDEASAGPTHLDVIAKRFLPKPLNNAPVGSLPAVEHDRHMRAFLVEAASYASLSKQLAEAGLAAPRVLYATEAKADKPFTVLLEDITSEFPLGANGEVRSMLPAEVSAAIRWLAGFHALFWEDARTAERGLWSRGSYWHLDQLARLEMDSVPAGYRNRYLNAKEWKRLRAAATAIDRRLSGQFASAVEQNGHRTLKRFQTLLHGDAKPENILCSVTTKGSNTEGTRCAGLDFAWVGEGYGMYDIMYILWGEYTQDIVDAHLAEYHAELTLRLPSHASKEYTPAVMRQHFELCVVDFLRWWVGFKGGEHFWAMPWAMSTFRDVLQRLDDGQLLSEQEYSVAVDREFPLH